MLGLLLIFSGLGRLTSTGHYSETSHLQITVPQKLGTNTNDGSVSEKHVIYTIKIDRKTYTLYLYKQSFLDPDFLVYSYNKSGTLYPHSSLRREHCFYQGYAKEIPNSAVTINTCSGLRGLLQLENVSYGIEPLELAATYEHMLYQITNNKDFLSLQENYPMTQMVDQSYRILVKSEKKIDVELLKRTLKIQIIMDKALYDYMGSDVSAAAEKVIHIFGLINIMFSQLKVTVMLTYLELWSDQNKILSDGHADKVLERFVSWKDKFLFQRPHDMAFLLIYRNYTNYVGATYHGMACNPKLAAGIALYPKKITLEAFSVLMAQLLGINLGLTYDDISNCQCLDTKCIMNPQTIHSHGVKFFSQCSVDEFKRIASQPEFECLQNQAVSKLVVQGRQSICGNELVEVGEQCDCGTKEKCDFKKCCHLENCTLIGFSECGSGACCNKKTCMFHKRGHLCRKSTDPCDFSEYCSGTSELCAPDMRAVDFEPCNNNTAYCYQGLCRDPDRQCSDLFGKFAKGSSYLCSEEVNFLLDDFGNCHGAFCNFPNTLCGKIVCHWTHARVLPNTTFDIQYTFLGGNICMSGSVRNRSVPKLLNNLYVHDGTICDKNKVCISGKCQEIVKKKDSCDSTRLCNGHGICNTNWNCQCDVGYTPPTCEPTPSSPGGSIDDGFWVWSGGKILNLPIKKRHASLRNGLLISFCVFLPFLILIAIITLKWKKIKFWKSEEIVSEGSTSEASFNSKSYTEFGGELKEYNY
ncbi:A disintegrin and metallopeptidase domain 3-like [Saccopteryx bilineata]|uniref:A disintegrin and metallopeptidase domain 3-like n=1 Tax=Saccopteryx bilineata TaxID=59482 RepID=UPI0033902E81